MKLSISKRVFNKRYYGLLNDNTRTQILFGGSSSGKSYFLAQRCMLDVLGGDRNYLICRQVGNTIRKSTFNEIVKAIRFFKVSNMFKINKTELTITCQNGYQILFVGLDDVEKVKSITPEKGVITDIWVEEATETERKSIKQLYKRLRGQSNVIKRIILSLHPIFKEHWLYAEYFGNWQDDKNEYRDDSLLILHTTYKDNDFLTKDDIQSLENEDDLYYYNVYTLGKWGALGHIIFKNWRVEEFNYSSFDKWRVGLDFGFASDPAAMPVTHYDKKKSTIYIFKELYEQGLTNDVLAEQVIDLINDTLAVCDSSEPKSIAELNRYGVKAIPAEKGKDSVNHGIQWLQQQSIIIHPNCKNMIKELQLYKWKENRQTGKAINVPVDKDNHLIDALRYAYETESKQYAYQAKIKSNKIDMSEWIDEEEDDNTLFEIEITDDWRDF